MPKAPKKHPVRRVRDMLKSAPKELDLRRHATAAGFSELIGRSLSYIRNVECGTVPQWDRLAARIEKKTGVSSEWLLSNPSPEDPVLDRHGNVWNPAKYLDELAPPHGMPDWRMLSKNAPSQLVRIMTGHLKAMLVWDLSLGLMESATEVNKLFMHHKAHQYPILQDAIKKDEKLIGQAISERVHKSHTHGIVDSDQLEKRLNLDLSKLSVDDAATILDEEGAGWVMRLTRQPESGPIVEMLKFHNISIGEPEW